MTHFRVYIEVGVACRVCGFKRVFKGFKPGVYTALDHFEVPTVCFSVVIHFMFLLSWKLAQRGLSRV